MPSPLLLRRLSSGPTGYRRGRLTLPTTDSGWATYNEGSRLFLPAATNEYKNPRLIEDGTTGWPGYVQTSKNVTGTPVSDVLPNGDGTYYHELVYTILAGDEGLSGTTFGVVLTETQYGPFAESDPATSALEYQIVASNARSCTAGDVAQYAMPGFAGVVYVNPPATSEWVRTSVTKASLPAGTTGIRVYVKATVLATCVAGDTITLRWRYMGVVKSTTLTPHFDGSYDNCAWTGTADASTSVRTVSDLDVDAVLGSTAFTIAGRFTPLWAANDGLAHNLLTLYAGADARVTIYKHTDNKLYCTVTDGTDSASSATAALSFAANSTHTFVARCTWAGTVDLNLDGTDAAQGDASAVAAQTIDSIVFDGGPTGYVGPVEASGTRQDDDWTAAIQADDGAAFGDLNLLWNNYTGSGDILLPLESTGRGYVKR